MGSPFKMKGYSYPGTPPSPTKKSPVKWAFLAPIAAAIGKAVVGGAAVAGKAGAAAAAGAGKVAAGAAGAGKVAAGAGKVAKVAKVAGTVAEKSGWLSKVGKGAMEFAKNNPELSMELGSSLVPKGKSGKDVKPIIQEEQRRIV